MTFSGRDVAAAIFVIEIDDVFDAMMQSMFGDPVEARKQLRLGARLRDGPRLHVVAAIASIFLRAG